MSSLSALIQDFESYYNTWKNTPAVQPGEYVRDYEPQIKMHKTSVSEITATIHSLHTFLVSEKSRLLRIESDNTGELPVIGNENINEIQKALLDGDEKAKIVLSKARQCFKNLTTADKSLHLLLALDYVIKNTEIWKKDSSKKADDRKVTEFYQSAQELIALVRGILFLDTILKG